MSFKNIPPWQYRCIVQFFLDLLASPDYTPPMPHTGLIPDPHTIDPETGFVESKAFLAYAFDSDRKQAFLQRYEANCLALYQTCEELGLHTNTVNKHLKIDPAFFSAYQEVRTRYLDKLQAVGRLNALNPKSVIERIWVQKSNADVPGYERYAEQNKIGQNNLTVNLIVDKSLMDSMIKREKIIEGQVIISTPTDEVKTVDVHGSLSASLEDKSVEKVSGMKEVDHQPQ